MYSKKEVGMMEKKLKMEIAVDKMKAYIFKIPQIVIKEWPAEKDINKNLKWIFYIVVPKGWKIREILVVCIPNGKVIHFSYERCKYDKCLYYAELITRFEERGKKRIVLVITFGKRGGIKICQIKTKI